MRNIVKQIRDVLFKDLYAAIIIYEKNFYSQLLNFNYDVRLKSEKDSVLLTFNYFSIDKTQSIKFNA